VTLSAQFFRFSHPGFRAGAIALVVGFGLFGPVVTIAAEYDFGAKGQAQRANSTEGGEMIFGVPGPVCLPQIARLFQLLPFIVIPML
jgi:hypothetical protein